VGGVAFVALLAFATIAGEETKSRDEKPPKKNVAK
jgi:hypothetical protein